MQKSTFVFDSYTIDLPHQLIKFIYKIQGEEESFTFTEKLHLPKKITNTSNHELLDRLVSRMHLMFGVSYWKLFTSYHIQINSTHLTDAEADTFDTIYFKGLGEFFYKNRIDFHNLIRFPSAPIEIKPISHPQKDRSLVALGGGKDSLVSIELLKKQNKEFTGFILQTGKPHDIPQDTADIAQIETLTLIREMDPHIFELNKRQDVYNGHIPVSTLFAYTGLLLSVLYDYRYVIVSNEQSASYGNVQYLGEEINHQWSKSEEFEKIFQEYVHTFITPDVTYFSYLRPFFEIAIVKEFVKYPQYFAHFSSCNRNFISQKIHSDRKWCGECPKCAFVFLLLSAFLSKDQLLNIFKENLFAKSHLSPVYKQLLGVEGVKPFECVGTPDESMVAFHMAYQKKDYNDDTVMKMFVNEVLPTINNIDLLQKEVFAKIPSKLIPQEFKAGII